MSIRCTLCVEVFKYSNTHKAKYGKFASRDWLFLALLGFQKPGIVNNYSARITLRKLPACIRDINSLLVILSF